MTAVVLRADARSLPLPDASVDLVVTSPPYWALRSYTDGDEHYNGQIGSEKTPGEYVAALLECTREWMRVLKLSGSIFVNLGDKYGSAKSLLGLPWRYAHGCMDDLGLILRRDIIWSKPNGLPESVTDRCRSSHEYVFHLVKQPRYFAAVDEIREPAAAGVARGAATAISTPLGKLPGSVWEIPSQPLIVPDWLDVDHFAAFPIELPRRIILGWSPPGICVECGEGRRPVANKVTIVRAPGDAYAAGRQDRRVKQQQGRSTRPNLLSEHTITGYACACPQPSAPTRPAVVVDPFGGTGATALVADVLGRTGYSFDMSADYCRLAVWRTRDPGERAKALRVAKPPPVPDGQASLFEGLGEAS